MAKILFLRVYSPGHEYCDVDTAQVTLSRGMMETVLARNALVIEAKRKDPDLYEIYFWDYAVTYFEMPGEWKDSEEAEELTTALDNEGYFIVEEGPVIPDYVPTQVEFTQMAVTNKELNWVAVPKHGVDLLETVQVEIDVIREWLEAMKSDAGV